MYKPSISIIKDDSTIILNRTQNTYIPSIDNIIKISNVEYEILTLLCDYDNNRIDIIVRIHL